eukprot:gene14063-16172_t
MDIFLSIPEEISKWVLVEWLEIFHVAKLDSAYLSHNSRARFLGLVSDPQNEFVHDGELGFSSIDGHLKYLVWLAKRECRVRSVCIPAEFADDSEHLRAFFHICGSSLRQTKVRTYESKHDAACESIIAHVTEYCHHLQQLTLTGRFPENPNLLHQLSLRCPYINKLAFQDCNDYKGDRNKDLSFFALRTFEASDTFLSDHFLVALALGSANLQELSLNEAYNLSARGFDVIAANCPLLQTVRLMKMETEDAHVLPVVRSCKSLRNIEIVEPHESFMDASLAAISENCFALHTLRLEECGSITDEGVDKVLKSCTNLRELSLDGTMFLTDATLYSIAKRCPLLTSLSIESCCYYSESGLAAVAEACTHLQRIAFSTSGALTQDSAELFSDQVEVVCEEGFNDYIGGAMYEFMDILSDDDSD